MPTHLSNGFLAHTGDTHTASLRRMTGYALFLYALIFQTDIRSTTAALFPLPLVHVVDAANLHPNSNRISIHVVYAFIYLHI